MKNLHAAAIVKTFLGIYLIALFLICSYLLFEIWPSIIDEGGKQVWNKKETLWVGKQFEIADEIRLLFIVSLAAAVGSYIHAATSFATYVGNKRFVASWAWWYILRPLIGVALALLFYFVIRGGLLSVQSNATDFNPYGVAAVAGMVGIFSKQATDKLEEVFANLFRTEKGKGDDKRDDKLDDSVPVTDKMLPLKKIKRVTIDTNEEGVKFATLMSVVDERYSRVPVFDKDNICKYIIHQSLLFRFAAKKSLEREATQEIADNLTLKDFLTFEDMDGYVTAIGAVSKHATLGDVRARMEEIENCQDVLVTKTGDIKGTVLGWITNIDTIQVTT